MRNVIIFFFLLVGAASAQDQAKIVFFRHSEYVGAVGKWKEFVDGKLICTIAMNTYNSVLVTPGEHTITWQMGGEKIKANQGGSVAKTINFESGKSYYFEMDVTSGAFKKMTFSMNQLTESEANEKMTQMKEGINCF